MSDPYTVLGVATGATEAEIRHRYLELVRQFPPEREPQRAAEIRQAYDLLRDPVRRMTDRLFDIRTSQTFESLLSANRPEVRGRRFSTQFLLSLGQP
jgi:curved DNA-binding protein CbpA